jgi:hypothetical protein
MNPACLFARSHTLFSYQRVYVVMTLSESCMFAMMCVWDVVYYQSNKFIINNIIVFPFFLTRTVTSGTNPLFSFCTVRTVLVQKLKQ